MRTRWEIETILFRVAAMLQGDKHLVLGIRDGTLPLQVPRLKGSRTQELSGTAGYNAYVAGSADEGRSPQLLFVLPKPRPRSSFNPPECGEPQLCCARRAIHRGIRPLGSLGPLATCDRQDVCLGHRRVRSVLWYTLVFLRTCSLYYRVRVKVVRGAISNGHEWAFMLLRLNENRKGGTYKVSRPMQVVAFERNYPSHVMIRGPDVVAGILAHWVRRRRSHSVGCIYKSVADRAPQR